MGASDYAMDRYSLNQKKDDFTDGGASPSARDKEEIDPVHQGGARREARPPPLGPTRPGRPTWMKATLAPSTVAMIGMDDANTLKRACPVFRKVRERPRRRGHDHRGGPPPDEPTYETKVSELRVDGAARGQVHRHPPWSRLFEESAGSRLRSSSARCPTTRQTRGSSGAVTGDAHRDEVRSGPGLQVGTCQEAA